MLSGGCGDEEGRLKSTFRNNINASVLVHFFPWFLWLTTILVQSNLTKLTLRILMIKEKVSPRLVSQYLCLFYHCMQALIWSAITYWCEGWVDDITQCSSALSTPTGSILLNMRCPSGPMCVCVCVCVLLPVPLCCPARTVRGFKRGGVQANWPISFSLPHPIPSLLSFVCLWPSWDNGASLVWAVIWRRRAGAQTERWKDCGREWKQQWDTERVQAAVSRPSD